MRTVSFLLVPFTSALLACAACSAPSAGQSTGESLTTSPSLRAATAQYTQNQNQSAPVLTINVGDQPIECGSGPAVGSTYLGISIGGADAKEGTFSVGAGLRTAATTSPAQVVRLQSAGNSAVSSVEEGATGTITISHVFQVTDDPSKSTVSGTYDISFPEGRITGTFDAQGCASELGQLVP